MEPWLQWNWRKVKGRGEVMLLHLETLIENIASKGKPSWQFWSRSGMFWSFFAEEILVSATSPSQMLAQRSQRSYFEVSKVVG